ncbi:MAG: LysR family transcriptional regulator [Phascolarctobacterium sp.]|uniref:LysR family transcriptional regulator n=1 Tax=Phascolarctobacterium sp. TaxID=2049039 RepID=UPI0026DB93AF|nr:LysR family transcriptional regulator [Phascolarctobacterium sp.]MDO4921782.1 LysR family transcriptional regulator [Phascolarctobacterium sp.]
MLKQIKYFQAVVRCKNFTEAAEECFISQSAISQQLQNLENELGVRLLNRENRKFSLTPAGEHFYRQSLILTADFERLRRETVRIAQRTALELRIGYLKSHSRQEFALAIADFAAKYPNVAVQIMSGSHEDLYYALRNDGVDLILSDQRRAFSDEYVNCVLAIRDVYVEIAARNPLSALFSVELAQLKNIPCILVAAAEQQETERNYYRDVLGVRGDFLFAENLEEARFLVIRNKGFLPVDSGEREPEFAPALSRVLLTRKGKPIKSTSCAFWRADNSGYYVEEFADMLKSQFASENN